MGYDKQIAERIRTQLPPRDGITEISMFGGLAFLVNGNMAVAASSEGGILVRIDPTQTEALIKKPGVEMAVMRRPMRGWLLVSPDVLKSETDLQEWIDLSLEYVQLLPPKRK